MKKECHPLCEIFPRMSEKEFEMLEKSIKEDGLRERIVLHRDGRILDGRCRQEACEKVGVEPTYRTFSGSDEQAASFVVAANIVRRHLTTSQCAALAAEALAWYQAEAKKRQEEHANTAPGRKAKNTSGKNSPSVKGDGRAAARAAKDFKTNPRYVKAAAKLKEKAPDLHEQVKSGALKIPVAVKILEKRQEEVKRPKNPKEIDWDTEASLLTVKLDKFDKKLMAIEGDWQSFIASYFDTLPKASEEVGKMLRERAEAVVGAFKRCVNLFNERKTS